MGGVSRQNRSKDSDVMVSPCATISKVSADRSTVNEFNNLKRYLESEQKFTWYIDFLVCIR